MFVTALKSIKLIDFGGSLFSCCGRREFFVPRGVPADLERDWRFQAADALSLSLQARTVAADLRSEIVDDREAGLFHFRVT
ncbi:hypothetical protein NDN16_17310 [Aureimonas altamirensis]|uniref:hypothetical protein n=1 Tax=Aureimonas altamirensis TaxID=370622 RepID=UPI002036EB2A|nr:hypothetical protein [Aureimonas altamirensis]MCM2505429.1 hypothetical protein [Aureimonas altamirensis]